DGRTHRRRRTDLRLAAPARHAPVGLRHRRLVGAVRCAELPPRGRRHVRRQRAGRPPARAIAAQPVLLHHVPRELTMGSTLGANRYGKAEVRLVRVDRGTTRHEVTDLTVSVSLTGDLAATHLTGDNSAVLPTDSQKNTVYAFARDGVGAPEAF